MIFLDIKHQFYISYNATAQEKTIHSDIKITQEKTIFFSVIGISIAIIRA